MLDFTKAVSYMYMSSVNNKSITEDVTSTMECQELENASIPYMKVCVTHQH